jgi:hypothetical protein
MEAAQHYLRERLYLRSQDNAVGIATGYGLDERGIEVRSVPVELRILPTASRPNLGAHPASYPVGRRGKESGA